MGEKLYNFYRMMYNLFVGNVNNIVRVDDVICMNR